MASGPSGVETELLKGWAALHEDREGDLYPGNVTLTRDKGQWASEEGRMPKGCPKATSHAGPPSLLPSPFPTCVPQPSMQAIISKSCFESREAVVLSCWDVVWDEEIPPVSSPTRVLVHVCLLRKDKELWGGREPQLKAAHLESTKGVWVSFSENLRE